MNEPVRWGILGTGKIARILANALAESAGSELVAVGSRDVERARLFAQERHVPRHGSYEQVLEDVNVDVVYVGIDHPLHREWAVSAAEAGKNVLCEKPLAVRRSDALQIVEAARRNDVVLLEAFAYRFHPQTERLIERIRHGGIGEVRVIDAAFGYDAGPAPTNYLLDRERGGGAILDVGCYPTSMAHLIAAAATGLPVVQTVQVAAAGRIGPTGVDLSSAATLVFDGGNILARVACSIEANIESSVRIYGSKGQVTVPSPWLPGRIGSRSEIVVELWGAEPEVIDIPVDVDAYTVEVDAVSRFIRIGERSPTKMTWEDSLAGMQTLDRWRSAVGVRYDGDDGT